MPDTCQMHPVAEIIRRALLGNTERHTMTTTQQRPQVTEPCPSWCVRDQREASKHAEDRYTRHRAEDVVVTMTRGPGGLAALPFAELTLSMDYIAYEVPCEDEWGPVVYFRGDDGSGSLVQLSLKVEDAKLVALTLLRLWSTAKRAEAVR